MEKEFNSIVYPDFAADEGIVALKQTAKDKVAEIGSAAKASVEHAEKRVVALEQLLQELEHNRTDENTTMADVTKRYPARAAQAQAELEDNDFEKDIGR